MSLFLAPIHKMMYHKIHFLDDLASSFATEEIKDKVNNEYPEVERGELAEVIDHSNIHGCRQGYRKNYRSRNFKCFSHYERLHICSAAEIL